jgi:hypothetical protein
MEITTRTTLDMLSSKSVSILTQRFVEGEQLGENHRRAFVNSESGRAEIAKYLEEPYITAVMDIWGDTPTVEEEGE